MISPCSLLADIGCDHGYVCIETVKNGKAKAAIASDVAEGPLKIAAENIHAAGLEDHISTVLADGLSGIPEDVCPDCIVMTGIGGLLMRRILGALQQESGSIDSIDSSNLRGSSVGNTCSNSLSNSENNKGSSNSSINSPDLRFKKLSQLVLGPQSDIDAVRHYLIDELHYPIVRELTVFDDGKYYTLLDVRPGYGNYAGEDDAGVNDMVNDTGVNDQSRTREDIDKGTGSGGEEGSAPITAFNSYTESEYLYGKSIDPSTAEVYRAYLDQQKQILTDAYHGALKGCSFGAAQAISDLKHRMALVDEAMGAATR